METDIATIGRGEPRSDADGSLDASASTSLGDAFSRSGSMARDELTPLLLASARRRIQSSRMFGSYCGGTLVMVGLFGTFLGLMSSVSNIQRVLDSLSQTRDLEGLFRSTQNIIFSSLGSMSIAFSTTFFGLIGSMLLGLLGRAASFRQEKAFKSLELICYAGSPRTEHSVASEFDRLIEGSPSCRRFRLIAQQADATHASLLRHVDGIVGHAMAERRKLIINLRAESEGMQHVVARALEAARQVAGRDPSRALAVRHPLLIAPPARPSLFRKLPRTRDPFIGEA